MRWCLMFHPDLAASAVVPESAVPLHRVRGWRRIGQYVADQSAAVSQFDEPIDLDAEPLGPTTPVREPASRSATSKEASR